MHNLLLWPIGTAFGLYNIVVLLLTFEGVGGKGLLRIVEGTEVPVPARDELHLVFLVHVVSLMVSS